MITRDYNKEARYKRHQIIKEAEASSRQAPATYAKKIEAAAKALAPKETDAAKESEKSLMASNASSEDAEEEEEVCRDKEAYSPRLQLASVVPRRPLRTI